jgi:hypothetical protein
MIEYPEIPPPESELEYV